MRTPPRSSKVILWIACLFLSALGTAFIASPNEQLVFEVNSFKALLVSALVALFGWYAFIKKNLSFNLIAALLSGFFALATVLGMQIRALAPMGSSSTNRVRTVPSSSALLS